MKKRGVIAVIILIIAVCLLIAGLLITIQTGSNKERIVTSFNDLKSALEETFQRSNTTTNKTSFQQTINGQMKMNINSLLGNSSDGSDVLINNINNSTFDYNYIIDTAAKKFYIDGSLLFNGESLIGFELYQADNIMYYLFKNIFDRYIVIDNIDFFSYLENSQSTKEDISYIYNKMIESLKNNLTQKDITVGTEDIDGTATKKISISIDNKRFMELAEAIVDDLNKDEKAKEILDSFLENAEITTKESEEEVNISYSIFLEKDEIIRYSFNAKDSNEDYSIIFDDKNKSIILESAGEEILRGDITKEGNTITIDIIVNNENIGSISYGDTSTTVDLTFNTADNVAIMVNLNSTRTDNTINTNMEISASTGDYAITFLTLSDTCNITDGVADFSNINTTDSINLNDLTEEDLTTIQNRLMVVLYNYLGLDLSIYNTGLNI
ncbi:MAG TPA: hypothetical protein IAB45_00040 [Candidatus Onthousia faecavium]|nr:hypothetical protein [Candidatus Onthousia faecavium]